MRTLLKDRLQRRKYKKKRVKCKRSFLQSSLWLPADRQPCKDLWLAILDTAIHDIEHLSPIHPDFLDAYDFIMNDIDGHFRFICELKDYSDWHIEQIKLLAQRQRGLI